VVQIIVAVTDGINIGFGGIQGYSVSSQSLVPHVEIALWLVEHS